MRTQKFVVPLIPNSTNAHWGIRVVKKRNSYIAIKYVSKKSKEFAKNLKKFMSTQKYKTFTGKLKVVVNLYFKTNRERDVDNFSKNLFDSFKGILYVDDKQIYNQNFKKHIGTGKDDYFDIEITEV